MDGEVGGGGHVRVRERLVDEGRLESRHARAAELVRAVDAGEAERRRFPQRLRWELLLRTRTCHSCRALLTNQKSCEFVIKREKMYIDPPAMESIIRIDYSNERAHTPDVIP